MKLSITAITFVFALALLLTPLNGQSVLTPQWLAYLGSGANAYSCTSGTCNLTDELWFKSFNVSSGATVVNAGGNGPLIVRATGSCTIAGTINGAGGPVSGTLGITGVGDFGGAGGGGGGGAGAGFHGQTTQVHQGGPVNSGGAGGAAGSTGGTGVSVSPNQGQLFIATGSSWPGGGALGGYGYAWNSSGGQAGSGGTPVVFICGSINFTGAINVNGGAGQNSSRNGQGAGGGGGGGYVVLAAKTWTANTGIITFAGGAGGSCGGFTSCGSGGFGGNGWAYTLTIR
jgi:hypothetical protein